MNDMIRLIEGLAQGDPTALAVGLFAVIGTIVIVVVVAIIRARR